MVEKEIENIIAKFIQEIKKNGIKIIKIYLFGSYAHGNAHQDSDIDIAVISKKFAEDTIEQNMKLWKIAIRVDTRIAPLSFSASEFKKEHIPIVTEVKKGVDLTRMAA